MAKKLFLVLVAVFLVFGSAYAADFKEGVSDDTIKIGSFQAKTGPVAAIGLNVEKGLVSYINYVNKNGGVFGRKIDLIVADDQFNPAKTTVEVKRLVEEDGVFAIVGGLGSPGCLAVMDYLNKKKVPFVYQGSGSSKLAIPPKKYVFPVQPNFTVQANIYAHYLVETKKAKRIAFIYRNDDVGKESRTSLTKKLKDYNLELVADIGVKPSDQDFSTQITRIMASKPDAVIFELFIPQSVNFIKQAKEYGLKDVVFLTNYANPDITYIKLAKEAAEGVEAMAWVIAPIDDPGFEGVKVFQQTYEGEMPTAYAAGGFIAGEVFTQGLRMTGEDLTRAKYTEALETMKGWTGIMAQGITYKEYDLNDNTCRLGKMSMYPLKVRNGAWVIPEDVDQDDPWIQYEP